MSQRSTSIVCGLQVAAVIAGKRVDTKPAAARVGVVGLNVELGVRLASGKDLLLCLVFFS